ncbi:MAG: 4-(cytidine 5'-diphospho)-2-C-methyl-D-erythritol kinase [Desulfobacterales bacterium]|nr:4-(cytidine 5'-diphospho)-2-C-methyl-D-erythritol kinase [Desulfobacterales bacterium]
MTETVHLESTAKVNLRLEILKKREDGYHELRTILQKINLHDLLHFSLKKERGISIKTNHPNLPVGKRNLVYQAVQSILKKSDYRGGVLIEIEKRIPLGAGLGGGSSNAATTLKAMNQLLKINLPQKELMAMGLEIGADVPFFFLEGAAIASGIGERLKKIELPWLWFVLIYPNFEVSTRWAYQNFILTKRRFHFNLHGLLRTPKEISNLLWNDLEEVVSRECPQIGVMKKMLYSAGALGALMTGSGPTVFGVFSEEGGASEAYKKVKKMVRGRGWSVLNAYSIPAS